MAASSIAAQLPKDNDAALAAADAAWRSACAAAAADQKPAAHAGLPWRWCRQGTRVWLEFAVQPRACTADAFYLSWCRRGAGAEVAEQHPTLHMHAKAPPPSGVTRRALGAQLRLWLVFDDLVPRGEAPYPAPAPCAGVATFCGLPIAASITTFVPQLLATQQQFPTLARPLALYHGTCAAIAWVASEPLRASQQGMLGSGCVYLGPWWKATRFAGFQRAGGAGEYTPAPHGTHVVLRVLVFAAAVRELEAADEDLDWTSVEAARLPPTPLDPQGKRWLVRNAEWAAQPSLCLMRHIVVLDVSSMARNPWRPWRRSQRFA